ncbi:hypothetical protein [Arenibaculum pallidiluteum]|uniref:hypothetical protein n=1 Tax=Arenibaculum pallidiluteum TaxID=2812559 RepID=UPI001A96A352|nr:hypothetical protein [Arenibaculum pallidiluteum]
MSDVPNLRAEERNGPAGLPLVLLHPLPEPAVRAGPLRRLALPGALVALSLSALLVLRLGILDLGSRQPLATGGAMGVLLVSGLLLMHGAIRLEAPPAMPDAQSGPLPPMEPGRMLSAPAAQGPDEAALLPVLRLMAANLDRLRAVGAPVARRPIRLACRLYAAGASDARAAALGLEARAVLDACMALLGEDAAEARRFASVLDGFLVSPAHLDLYRAGQADLASGATPGDAFVGALTRWADAWEAEPAGEADGWAVVVAIAPLEPRHLPAVEAVMRAFGGEPCSRPGHHLAAAFPSAEAAIHAARALSEAAGAAADPRHGCPGVGVALARIPRPGADEPAGDPGSGVAAALALAADAGPGEIALSPALRTGADVGAAGPRLPANAAPEY